MASPSPKKRGLGYWFERFAYLSTVWTGTSWAFILACVVILVWAVTGPLFQYSDTWQLVINTGTTIVTFLMVFLIQRAQNKESLAVQVKLNEIVAALKGASNRLINVEDLSEDEVRQLHACYEKLARAAEKDCQLGRPHSIEEVENETLAPAGEAGGRSVAADRSAPAGSG
jgi:low affinity Fe/Cu permease